MKQAIFENCIFRYRKLSVDQIEKNIDAFEKDRLFFSTPANFNDPYDSLLYVDREKISEDIQHNWKIGMDSYLDKLQRDNPQIAAFGRAMWYGKNRQKFIDNYFNELYEKIEKVKNNIRNRVKIICFSQDCLSLPMWAHYAEEHKGFILVYDKDEIMQAKCFDKSHNKIKQELCLKPICYSDTRTNMTDNMHEYLLKYEMPSSMDVSKLPDIPPLKMREFILSKRKDWEYEKEWRLIPGVIDIKKDNPLCYISIIPKAVILGEKCLGINQQKLCEIASKKGVPVFKARINDGVNYDMKIEDIDI